MGQIRRAFARKKRTTSVHESGHFNDLQRDSLPPAREIRWNGAYIVAKPCFNGQRGASAATKANADGPSVPVGAVCPRSPEASGFEDRGTMHGVARRGGHSCVYSIIPAIGKQLFAAHGVVPENRHQTTRGLRWRRPAAPTLSPQCGARGRLRRISGKKRYANSPGVATRKAGKGLRRWPTFQVRIAGTPCTTAVSPMRRS